MIIHVKYRVDGSRSSRPRPFGPKIFRSERARRYGPVPASAASCRAASHQAWPSSPAISRNRPGATRSLTGRRWPSSSSIQAWIQAVVRRIREHALHLLRAQLARAFGDDPGSPVTDQLARFALAAIDGAFVAIQADHGATLGRLLEPLAPALVASRRALLAGPGRDGRRAQAGRRT